MLHEKITQAFTTRFGTPPSLVVRAPGRVNLIGEHTDYNDGFVMPMAIDRGAWVALRPRADEQVFVYSLDFEEMGRFDFAPRLTLAAGFAHEGMSWVEYMKGVAWALQGAGYGLRGWEGVVVGNVPIGAGLSSSAALELATARVFGALGGWEWEAAEMAKLAQKAENQWVGVNCGIMDQMISAAGEADHALLIDCRSLASEAVPLPSGNLVVVLDTATRRGLVDSAYNERREQCEAAARFFGVSALRDVSVSQFEARANQLDELTRRRARHVITENARTLEAAEAMRQGDASRLGQLMNKSHRSLRDDFEVSSEALDVIVEIARGAAGCLGARMTGAGFGGCAVALVTAEAVESFTSHVATEYEARMGLTPRLYVCRAMDGAGVVA